MNVGRTPWVVACVLNLTSAAHAQTPVPSPLPERLGQDELSLQVVRSSVVQGSGARAFGMGGAFLARADDATAASWNPAGLSYLRRPELSFVWTRSSLNSLIIDSQSGGDVEDNRRSGQSPDFAAVTWPFELGSVSGAAQVSFQRVISFSTTRKIRRTGGRRIDVESSGGFDVLALGSGWRLGRSLRVGATLNRWTNGYSQTLNRVAAVTSNQDLRFDISAWNVHMGVIWSPIPNVNIGAVAKTPFTADVTLVRSRQDEGGVSRTFSSEQLDDPVRLELPEAVGLGVSWRPESRLTISVDYTRTAWSGGRILNFFTLPPVGEPQLDEDLFKRLPYPTLDDANQHDTEEIRAGVEHVVLFEHVKWPIRLGAFSDRQYFNEPDGVAPRFAGFSVGSGLIVGPVLIDAAYVFESGRYDSRDGERPTRVSVRSHRLHVSIIYRHP